MPTVLTMTGAIGLGLVVGWGAARAIEMRATAFVALGSAAVTAGFVLAAISAVASLATLAAVVAGAVLRRSADYLPAQAISNGRR